MAKLTLQQARNTSGDDLGAIMVSGKNPDGTKFIMGILEVIGSQISYNDAKATSTDDLIAIIVSGKLPNGDTFAMTTQ